MSRGARGPGASSKCRHTARSSPGLPQSAAQELAAPPLSLRSAVSEGYGPAVLRARFHQIHHLRDPYRRSRPPRRPCPLARSPAPGQSGQPRQRPAAAATDRRACRRRRPPAASRAAAPRKARPRPRPPRRSQRAHHVRTEGAGRGRHGTEPAVEAPGAVGALLDGAEHHVVAVPLRVEHAPQRRAAAPAALRHIAGQPNEPTVAGPQQRPTDDAIAAASRAARQAAPARTHHGLLLLTHPRIQRNRRERGRSAER